MRVDVTSAILTFLASVMVVMLIQGSSVQAAAAAAAAGKQNVVRRRLMSANSIEQCISQGEECDPYDNRCCSKMKCANLLGSRFCLGRFGERCMCLPKDFGIWG